MTTIVPIPQTREHFRIDDIVRMPPFLMTLVSGGDRWMYVASTGALTAGRRDPDSALFRYETDDRLFESDGQVGPRSVLWVERDGEPQRWDPFLRAADGLYDVRRGLTKTALSDEIWFEEQNASLGLTFRYGWRTGEQFGFVRHVELRNDGESPAHVRLMDGLVNIQPAGVERALQATYSNLVDAYKQSEMLAASDTALFRLSSVPVDRAVPSEALRTNVAWVRGLSTDALLLSTRQLDAFRRGEAVRNETATRGEPMALLATATLELMPGQSVQWCFGLDAELDARAVVDLQQRLGRPTQWQETAQQAVARDLDADRARLRGLVAGADGLQTTSNEVEDARHLANTLFNVMRGGTFVNDGRIERRDFARYLAEVAPQLAARVDLDDWPADLTRTELVRRAGDSGDVDLERLAREYLPLTFSRRHGDPSRPWNRFCIETHDARGEPRLGYEGNWRDIFQNWEALLHSYPDYAEAAVVKFVNATTIDGYNPYRVSRRGFDWERPDPSDPWANIGYWGDHQIAYLQRLLELCERHHPGVLADLMRRRIFVFADVPYRIAGYRDLCADPHRTITFDGARDDEIREQQERMGNEARLVPDGARDAARPRRAGLAEKLLVPVLAKLGNFVPGLGIWMNTQRPEWNDANNALVGRGVSVVTAAHLAAHVKTLRRILAGSGDEPLPVSRAVMWHAREVAAVLDRTPGDQPPGSVLDELGLAAERYRTAVHGDDAEAREAAELSVAEVQGLLDRAAEWLLCTVRDNRREDGLVHSYNVMVRGEVRGDGDELQVRRLPLMLEGQVAALGSDAFGAREAADLLDALATSALRRDDLGTYLLYPDRELPDFLAKGVVPAHELEGAEAAQALLAAGCNRILCRDAEGTVRFAPELGNAEDLARVCGELSLPRTQRAELAALYERVFDHAAFTGRSGTFFGYEGLGSVYWHMVSKLRLAVLETLGGARRDGEDPAILARLGRHYEDIRRGLGTGLDPARYGAFPSDPYSHTPARSGARQPGMTGQVKEDLLARRGELGVEVDDGQLGFVGSLVDPSALETKAEFSLCGVPVVLRRGPTPTAIVHLRHGRRVELPGARLDRELSAALFGRTGRVERLEVTLPAPAEGR